MWTRERPKDFSPRQRNISNDSIRRNSPYLNDFLGVGEGCKLNVCVFARLPVFMCVCVYVCALDNVCAFCRNGSVMTSPF